jgi:hypothetical protein
MVYSRKQITVDKQKVYGCYPGAKNTLNLPYYPITNTTKNGLNAEELLPAGSLTSLSDMNSVFRNVTDLNSPQYLSQPYDALFLKSKRKAVSKLTPGVVDLVLAMNSANPAAAGYKPNTALQGMLYFKIKYSTQAMANNYQDYLDRFPVTSTSNKATLVTTYNPHGQKVADKRVRKSQTEALRAQNKAAALRNAAKLTFETKAINKMSTPKNLMMSFAAYRVFSDHLPVSTGIVFNH